MTSKTKYERGDWSWG